MVFFLLDVSRLADAILATIFTAAGGKGTNKRGDSQNTRPAAVSIQGKCREFLWWRLSVIGAICDTSNGPGTRKKLNYGA